MAYRPVDIARRLGIAGRRFTAFWEPPSVELTWRRLDPVADLLDHEGFDPEITVR
jgi:hypothetical protein